MTNYDTLPECDHNSTYLLGINDKKSLDGKKLQAFPQVGLSKPDPILARYQ